MHQADIVHPALGAWSRASTRGATPTCRSTDASAGWALAMAERMTRKPQKPAAGSGVVGRITFIASRTGAPMPLLAHAPVHSRSRRRLVLVALLALAGRVQAQDLPAPVPKHVPPQVGEHPRLFFRQADLPELRKRAATPEGKAIIARLKTLLGGGDAMSSVFGTAGKAYDNKNKDLPIGAFTISHAAGFGMLYQLTGDKKYAGFGKECFEKAWEGIRDRDDRYSWTNAGGALRAGPSLGSFAIGYDLCYDGWDAEFRKKVATELQNFGTGGDKNMTLESLANGRRHHPGSNHWGPQIGGAAVALLAIRGDPGTDDGVTGPLLAAVEKCYVRQLSEGWGNRGYYQEGDGPGAISSDTMFLPGLQAWRVAGGKDFVTPSETAQWMTLKWIMGTVGVGGKPLYIARGGYPHNVWARAGMSGSGTFAQGFGALPEQYKPALLWLFNHSVAAGDAKDAPFDTVSPYPLRAVLSLVNWPFDLKEGDPALVMPRAVEDKRFSFYMFRGRWQDENDVVVTALLKGQHQAPPGIKIISAGRIVDFPVKFEGAPTDFVATRTGGVVSIAGQSFGCDFSGASGADALLVMAGGSGGGGDTTAVTAGGTTFTVMAIGKTAPTAKAEGDKVVIGGQTVTYDGKRLGFAK
jgi:hypothetical protein